MQGLEKGEKIWNINCVCILFMLSPPPHFLQQSSLLQYILYPEASNPAFKNHSRHPLSASELGHSAIFYSELIEIILYFEAFKWHSFE